MALSHYGKNTLALSFSFSLSPLSVGVSPKFSHHGVSTYITLPFFIGYLHNSLSHSVQGGIYITLFSWGYIYKSLVFGGGGLG
jgi:hypothetical protein